MNLQTINASASPEVQMNENFETLEHQAVYGKRQPVTTGLTWGYCGGRWGGFSVTAGTVTLTDGATNYLVVEIATGTLSVSTSGTNWADTTNYARVYKITAASGAVTAVEDHRAGPSGVMGGSGGGGGGGGAATSYKQAVRAATTSAHTLASAFENGDTIDGVTLATGDRVLVKNQASAAENGIYVVAASGAPTRATDADASSEIAGFVVPVTEGTVNAGSQWMCTTAAPITVNTTALAFKRVAIAGIPQASKSADYTLVADDANTHLLHPSADTSARTFTIPANGSVPFPIGTAITIVNQNAAGTLTIAITTDTMRLAGSGATGSRTLTANGIATALKITSTEWIINGTGLT